MNKRSLISLLFMFIIINANVIAVKTQISNNTQTDKDPEEGVWVSPKDCLSEQEETKSLDFPIFIISMVRAFSASFDSYVRNNVEKATGLDTFNQGCKIILMKGFLEQVEVIQKEETLAEKISEQISDLKITIAELGTTKEEREILEQKKDNPRILCKTSLKILKRQKKQAKDFSENAEDIQKLIDKYIKKGYVLADLKKHSTDFWDRKNKLFLYEYMRDRTLFPGDKESFTNELLEVRHEITEAKLQADMNYNQASSTESPECELLPDSNKFMSKCLQAGFATRVYALFKMVKNATKADVIECIKGILTQTIVDDIISFFVDKLLGVVTHILGLVVVKIVKLVFLAIKMIYYIIKAIKNKTDRLKMSQYWGSAVGTAFRIVKQMMTVK